MIQNGVESGGSPRAILFLVTAAAACWPTLLAAQTSTPATPSFSKGVAPLELTTRPLTYKADGTLMLNGKNVAGTGVPFANGILPEVVTTGGLSYQARGQLLLNGTPVAGGTVPFANGIQPVTISTGTLIYKANGQLAK
jgi:hypothetical protein